MTNTRIQKHTHSAVKQNASGYTPRQSHTAVWPFLGTTPALSSLAAADWRFHSVLHEIPHNTDRENMSRGRERGTQRGVKVEGGAAGGVKREGTG